LIILTSGVLLHLAFAATGWFYRYEAYLILCATVVVPVLVLKYRKEALPEKLRPVSWAALLLIFALFFPFVLRSSAAYSKARQACLNIYDQQYQMGRFLKTYYDHDTIAANDIGAISYGTHASVVDLWGLGSIDVARSRKGGYWKPAFLDSLVRSRQVKLAIVFDEWFDPQLLQRWTKVGTWQISDNVICGSDIVSFYAIDRERAAARRRGGGQHLGPGPERAAAGTRAA
jgi:hypothetical protein